MENRLVVARGKVDRGGKEWNGSLGLAEANCYKQDG